MTAIQQNSLSKLNADFCILSQADLCSIFAISVKAVMCSLSVRGEDCIFCISVKAACCIFYISVKGSCLSPKAVFSVCHARLIYVVFFCLAG